MREKLKICVIGMGYVGLPLANLLSKKFKVSGYDNDITKIRELKCGIDRTGEILKINNKLSFFYNEKLLKYFNTYIICLPTPINKNKKPDIRILKNIFATLKKYVSKDDTIILESTVYPGLTKSLCKKYLKTIINIGYSPERVNPGDKKNTISKITKVISAENTRTLSIMKKIYGSINNNNIFIAKNIMTAEAAKIIENTQRDLNIALINELTILFTKMGISIYDVLEAAKTKWNFLNFTPGLVGGHCIGVDPYYLSYLAKTKKINTKIIIAGRNSNEKMVNFFYKKILSNIKKYKKPKILFIGVTFKPNVKDIRNSKYLELFLKLKKKYKLSLFDPYFDSKHNLNKLFKLKPFDVIVVSFLHKILKKPLNHGIDKLLTNNASIIDLSKGLKLNTKIKNKYKYISL